MTQDPDGMDEWERRLYEGGRREWMAPVGRWGPSHFIGFGALAVLLGAASSFYEVGRRDDLKR